MTNWLEMFGFFGGRGGVGNSAIGKATHNRVARPLHSLTPPMKHRLCVGRHGIERGSDWIPFRILGSKITQIVHRYSS